ncbi:unnamed protein product [Eruca vesicaria subsp. sativa]|uniref:Zinc finger GRF-type domain-containing protein n=1 Tax=Eruca vesicaria subsp. sativa TaxID=29727 RepID=A0ABC8JPZ3_ERUVS|nr:unnamed protein product [Eruca vesicaria subsp. sativa]
MTRSTSASSSSSTAVKSSDVGPLCRCSRATKVTLSWSDDNPGRRFHRCEIHGFVSWADTEEPTNWQKESLLEARDQIRHYKREAASLRSTLAETNATIEMLRSSARGNEDVEIHPSAYQLLDMFNATKNTMRIMFIITWVLLFLATVVIVAIIA